MNKIKPAQNKKHYYTEEQSGICVVRRQDETVEDLIRRFKKRYSKSGISKEVRQNLYFEKPSQKRRRKKMQSIRNIEKEKNKENKIKEQKGRFFRGTKGDKDD